MKKDFQNEINKHFKDLRELANRDNSYSISEEKTDIRNAKVALTNVLLSKETFDENKFYSRLMAIFTGILALGVIIEIIKYFNLFEKI